MAMKPARPLRRCKLSYSGTEGITENSSMRKQLVVTDSRGLPRHREPTSHIRDCFRYH